MPTRSEAEENLRVIRSLMEKATIYRAISAPVALVGGLASLLGCYFVAAKSAQPEIELLSLNLLFVAVWLGVLAVTGLTNVLFLWQDARRRGDVFISPGMKTALHALAPNHLVAAILTILWASSAHLLPVAWMIFYGLGLLATQHFAPRSIALLGWAFLAAGLASVIVFSYPHLADASQLLRVGNLAMGATFGLFHLIYAFCTWPRKARDEDSDGK
jgi:hypothetical protein